MFKSWREAVSRVFAGLLSAGLFYGVYRCVVGAIAATGPDLVGRRAGLIIAAGVFTVFALLLGLVAFMPVGLMERVYRPAPPITGDDGSTDRPRNFLFARWLVDIFLGP